MLLLPQYWAQQAARAARPHTVLVAPLPLSPGSLPATHKHWRNLSHTHTHDCPSYLQGGVGGGGGCCLFQLWGIVCHLSALSTAAVCWIVISDTRRERERGREGVSKGKNDSRETERERVRKARHGEGGGMPSWQSCCIICRVVEQVWRRKDRRDRGRDLQEDAEWGSKRSVMCQRSR